MLMWFDTILLIILTICVVTDLKSRKIYNKVIFPGLMMTFGSHFVLGGWEGLQFSIIGFLIGFVILLIPYLLGGMGAGDVKLLALIGALKGSLFVLYTAVYMAVIGGIMALIILLINKEVGAFFKSFILWMYGLLCGIKMSLQIPKNSLSVTYPYGIAIAGGALLSLL